MSHYYPMVSSSPPPFDENGHSFEDDNEDEFGDFSSAGTVLQGEPVYHHSNVNGNYDSFNFPQNVHNKQSEEQDDIKIVNSIEMPDTNSCHVSTVNGDDFGDFEDSFTPIEVNHINKLEYEDANQVTKQSDVKQEFEGRTLNENVENSVLSTTNEQFSNPDAEEVCIQNTSHEGGFQWRECESKVLENSTSEEVIVIKEENNLESENTANIVICNGSYISESTLIVEEVPEKKSQVFQSSPKRNSFEDDDFADFQNADEKLDDNEYDNFQTFNSVTLQPSVNETESFVTDFASFDNENFTQSQSFQTAIISQDVDEDDEFGNFESTSQILNSEHLMSSSLATIFINIECENKDLLSKIILLDDALKQKNSATGCNCIWENLNDIDNTQALTYHWNTSRSSKLLLHSLHLNSQNFLPSAKWAKSIPLFAANLGSDPLEPVKAPFKNAEDGTNSVVLDPSQPSPTISATVPPAQFDWGSSGLINPLDDSTSALLDLDFFLTNDYVISNSLASKSTNNLETEFLGSEPCSKSSYTGIKPFSPLIDKILSEATKTGVSGTSSNSRPRQDISEEAKHILNSLQDLSFMQARVLMFPIRDGNNYDL